MKKSEYLISELLGVPVYEPGKKGKPSKRVGKVRHFVFHPKARRVVGFTVKRPDIALMAHRSDLFVALDGFEPCTTCRKDGPFRPLQQLHVEQCRQLPGMSALCGRVFPL